MRAIERDSKQSKRLSGMIDVALHEMHREFEQLILRVGVSVRDYSSRYKILIINLDQHGMKITDEENNPLFLKGLPDGLSVKKRSRCYKALSLNTWGRPLIKSR